MGEFMKILSVRLPKAVIEFCIQPYLTISARQAKIRYYGVLKEMRGVLRQRREDERIRIEKQISCERKKRQRRMSHLNQIRYPQIWGRCFKCNIMKRTRYHREEIGSICRDCYVNTILIVNLYKLVYIIDDINVYRVRQLVTDRITRVVYEERVFEIQKRNASL